jgi:hypothetical protein
MDQSWSQYYRNGKIYYARIKGQHRIMQRMH